MAASIVRITGPSKILSAMPERTDGIELWAHNNPSKYNKRSGGEYTKTHFTRWYNLHSRQWIEHAYMLGLRWHQAHKGKRPLYMQRRWKDIPGSRAFPRAEIQAYFATARGPMRFFTCTIAWQIAQVIYERTASRVELYGITLGDKDHPRYRYQRPCVLYWIRRAREAGLEVGLQPAIAKLRSEPGDPETYAGPLYGYDTKPEASLIRDASWGA